jgi:hypothetical protein
MSITTLEVIMCFFFVFALFLFSFFFNLHIRTIGVQSISQRERLKLQQYLATVKLYTLYRAPSGDFNQFLMRLDTTLKYLYNPKSEFIICGDIQYRLPQWKQPEKTNKLIINNIQFDTHCKFATRIQNNSSTAINNIFVDSIRLNSSSASPIISGLSDHDAQLLTINNIVTAVNLIPLKQRTIKINNDTIMQFLLLKNEKWESVYKYKDINNKYN